MIIPKSWGSQQQHRDYLNIINKASATAPIAYCDWDGCPGISAFADMDPAPWDNTVSYHRICLLGGVMNAPEWSD